MGDRVILVARAIVLLMAAGLFLPFPYDSEPEEGGGNPLLFFASASAVLFITMRLCCNLRNRVLLLLEIVTYGLFAVSWAIPVIQIAWDMYRGKPAEPNALLLGCPVIFVIVGMAALLIKDSVKALLEQITSS